MPYYFGEEDIIEWPDEDSDLPPRLDQFHYIAASDFSGSKAGPIRFTVPAFDPSFGQAQQTTPTPKCGFLDRLLGRNAQSASQPVESSEYFEKRWRQLVALMVPALKELGVKQLYCRYDGGNDEGFTWFDHAIMRSGEKITVDTLAQRMSKTGLPKAVYDANIVERKELFPDQVRMTKMLNNWLADEWACQLLGNGYGTGPFSMYGAFTVDLDDCTIVDDPDADPVVQNIEIAE